MKIKLLSQDDLIMQLNIQIALLYESVASSGDYDDDAPRITRLQIIRDLLERYPDDMTQGMYDADSGEEIDEIEMDDPIVGDDFRLYADRDLLTPFGVVNPCKSMKG